MNSQLSITRKEHFNAAHRLYRQDWTDEKNWEVFGKCSYPHYHGHNYNLEVTLTGAVDPETGYVADLKWLSDLVNEQVLEKLDHKNLNLDVPELAGTIPTVENIIITIYNILRPLIPERYELRLRLYETERNYADYPA